MGACNTRRRASLLVSHHKDFYFVVVVISTCICPTEFEHFFVCLSGNLQLSKATGVECLPGNPPLPPQVSRGCWQRWRPPQGRGGRTGCVVPQRGSGYKWTRCVIPRRSLHERVRHRAGACPPLKQAAKLSPKVVQFYVPFPHVPTSAGRDPCFPLQPLEETCHGFIVHAPNSRGR